MDRMYSVPGGAGGGPIGCGAAVTILAITVVAMGGFLTAIWWLLRDLGQVAR